MTTNNEHVKLHCNTCHGLRRHSILFSTAREHHEEYEEGHSYYERMLYRVAECDGCESVSMHTTWDSSGQPDSIEEQWPPKVSRSPPKWMLEIFLSDSLDNPFKYEFMREIYSSLKAETCGSQFLEFAPY